MLEWLTSDSQPNWVVTSIFGALVGALMTEYGAILTYPFRRLRRDLLEGAWHQFNYTHRDGKPVLNRAILKIKKGLLGGLRVTMEDETGDLSFRGTVRREGGHIIAELKAVSHEETLMLRFIGAVIGRDAFMPGIWMAHDRDFYPAAGAALLCRDNEDIEKARQVIGRWSMMKDSMLRVVPPGK